MDPILNKFYTKYESEFSFNSLNAAEKEEILQAIDRNLQMKNKKPSVKLALSSLRVLSRDKTLIKDWLTEARFKRIVEHACLIEYCYTGESVTLIDNMDEEVVTEATKCLCNLTFNLPQVQLYCRRSECALALLQRAKSYSDPDFSRSIQYYDMRFLFIITALDTESRSQASLQWSGICILSDVMSHLVVPGSQLSDEQCDLLKEILTTLYNLLLAVSPWKPEYGFLEEDMPRLAKVISRVIRSPCRTKEKHTENVRHASNIFTTMPKFTVSCLVPREAEVSTPSSSTQRLYDGHNVTCIAEILNYLETVLEGTSLSRQKEQLLPVLSALAFLCRSDRIIRKFCRLRVLPHLRDEVKRLPEEGDSLRNRLCKLLTTPLTEVKQMAAEFMFVLCKENVSRFIKYSGFGNAAGLLAQYGLMSGAHSASGGTEYSSDSDSETEEYKELEPDVNPVTGRYEAARQNPMEGMTEEQKEYEAVQLLNAMDKLQRLGIVQPSRVGADGRPVPIDHVLELSDVQLQDNTAQQDGDSD